MLGNAMLEKKCCKITNNLANQHPFPEIDNVFYLIFKKNKIS